ncbi:diguanylate cyclase [Candidatus Accumulibacter sp. ACC007]|uniref:sensor domain-containing protein n=1 Tax=Candidatus Accumulibacter sp. ACC007 TaxID=2823333 RepID=UPI0025C52648|nr:diguanylate cyclase [Candidatus Accumulibacter sp. ACC007]
MSIGETTRAPRKPRHGSRERFNAIVETTSDGILILDLRGKVLYCNPSACDLFSRPAADLLGAGLGVPIVAEGQATEIQILRSIGNKPGYAQVRAQKTHWGGLDAYLVVLTDISEHLRHAEAELHLAAKVFTYAREGIAITDAAGTIVKVNDAFSRISGYSREEVLGRNPSMFASGRQAADFYGGMWLALTTLGYWSGEIWNRHKNGEFYAALLTISAVHDVDCTTQNYVGFFSDITMIKEHQERLEQAAHYDGLTRLPNRVLLADRLPLACAQSQRRNRSLAVAFLDLDGFKAVNDLHGHDVGDQLLIVIAQRLKDVLREGDTLARLGGDEFVAVLIDLEHPQDCEPVLARMLQVTGEPVRIGDAVVEVSASIGATLYPQDAANSDTLLRDADQAMYQAKRAGRNRYHLFSVTDDAGTDR